MSEAIEMVALIGPMRLTPPEDGMAGYPMCGVGQIFLLYSESIASLMEARGQAVRRGAARMIKVEGVVSSTAFGS